MRLARLFKLFFLAFLIPFSSNAQVTAGNDNNLYRPALGPTGGILSTQRPPFCEGDDVESFTTNLLCDSLSNIEFRAFSSNCYDNQFNGGGISTQDSRIEFMIDSINNLQRLELNALIDGNQNWLHQRSAGFALVGYGFAGYGAYGNWADAANGTPSEGYFGIRVVRDLDTLYGWGYADLVITSSSIFLQVTSLAIEDACGNTSPPTAGFSTLFSNNCPNDEFCLINTSTDAISYLWELPDGTTSSEISPCISLSMPGNYMVRLNASNSNGTDVYEGMVTIQPYVDQGLYLSQDQNEICEGEMASFSAALDIELGIPNSYSWSLNGEPVGSNSPSFESANLQNGDELQCCITTDYRCIDINNLCQQMTIDVTSIVAPTISLEANDLDICEGELVIVSAQTTNGGSNPSYQWFLNGIPTGANSTSFSSSNLQDGDEISCRLISSSTCTSQDSVVSETVSMTVHPELPVEVFFVGCNFVACEGMPYGLSAIAYNEGSDPIYEWFVNGNPVVNNSLDFISSNVENGDTVMLRVTSSEECAFPLVATTTDIVQYSPLPTVSLEMEDTLCLSDQQLPLTGGMPAGGTYSGPFVGNNILNLSGIPAETTINITYRYTNEFNCSAEVTRPLNLVLCTSINELKAGLDFVVFPNPSDGQFQIQLPEGEAPYDMSIYSVAGQRIMNQSLRGGGSRDIDLSGWPAGVYLLELIGKDQQGWTKLVVE